MQARWWRLSPDNTVVECRLCFHHCLIPFGKFGYCKARAFTEEGGISSPYLGKFCSIAIDPIEKKPIYHWQPGTKILSLGSLGCTMRCPFCQNHSISQLAQLKMSGTLAENAPAEPEKIHMAAKPRLVVIPPEALVQKVKQHGLASVAYTYNEPSLQAEYIIEAAPLLEKHGIATVLVTNGMFVGEVRDALSEITAAANIDIKTFSAKQYARMGGSLKTVQETVRIFWEKKVHIELTSLIVPGISDSKEKFASLVAWVAALSPEIPLHISRYFPAYYYDAPATPLSVLTHFEQIARDSLAHVHLGNVRTV